MKIVVIKGRTVLIIALCLSLMLGISSAGMWKGPAIATGAPQKALPIYSVETPDKILSLGINCAWDNADIAPMLSSLKLHNVKATFFILGEWAEKYPASVKAIAEAGHEIGSHSYTHADLTTLSPTDISHQVTKSMTTLEQITGKKPRLIRPPSGAYNTQVIEIIRTLGYEAIQWDVDSLDWKGLTPEEMLLRITAKSDKGSILLLHSGAKHSAEALPLILQSLQNDGYTFTPIGSLIHPPPYKIDHTGRLQIK